MAHDALTAREILDRRDAAKTNLKTAHERQHGVAKANENLKAAIEAAEAEEESPKAKAQAKAEDKAAAGPKD